VQRGSSRVVTTDGAPRTLAGSPPSVHDDAYIISVPSAPRARAAREAGEASRASGAACEARRDAAARPGGGPGRLWGAAGRSWPAGSALVAEGDRRAPATLTVQRDTQAVPAAETKREATGTPGCSGEGRRGGAARMGDAATASTPRRQPTPAAARRPPLAAGAGRCSPGAALAGRPTAGRPPHRRCRPRRRREPRRRRGFARPRTTLRTGGRAPRSPASGRSGHAASASAWRGAGRCRGESCRPSVVAASDAHPSISDTPATSGEVGPARTLDARAVPPDQLQPVFVPQSRHV